MNQPKRPEDPPPEGAGPDIDASTAPHGVPEKQLHQEPKGQPQQEPKGLPTSDRYQTETGPLMPDDTSGAD